MNELIHIQNSDISVKEYRGQRVVTFKDVDLVHERADEQLGQHLIGIKTDSKKEKITSYAKHTKQKNSLMYLLRTAFAY